MDEKRRRFEALALPHLDAATNLARWLARSSADADDIVQEAMLRAFRGFDTFRGSDAKPWLLAIVRNCFLSAASRTRRNAHMPLPDDDGSPQDAALVSGVPNPEQATIGADQSRKLDRVIAALPLEFREVLILRELEDLSYRDISIVTGAPLGTVMSRLSRARALAKEKWLTDVEGVRHGMQ
ncbi:MAG TPA: sigma-70 family RNA polymerase sigma factor [Rhizomicrobium sp.]|jgi:RNA polymerase sigma-70 factor (ECF subfamily)|nr:sigma-70 family RNA polymerase sigma factor [Rhizomicrobium sp.]